MKSTNPDMSVNGNMGSSIHDPPISLLFLPENQDLFHASLGIKYEVPSPEPTDNQDLHFVYESNDDFTLSEQTTEMDTNSTPEEIITEDPKIRWEKVLHEMTAVVVDTCHQEIGVSSEINTTSPQETADKQVDSSIGASSTQLNSSPVLEPGDEINLDSSNSELSREFKFVGVVEDVAFEAIVEDGLQNIVPGITSEEKNEEDNQDNDLKLVDCSEQEVARHWQLIDGVYKCQVCDKSTPMLPRMELHILRIHMNIKPYACIFCHQGFCSTRSLSEHTNRVHDPTSLDGRYKCKVCGKQYLNKYKFKMHMNVHERKFQFRCHDCGKGFYYKYNMQIHVASQHVKTKIDEIKNMCEFCGKSFKNSGTLRTHKRSVHRTGNQFGCTLCSRTFSFQNKLESHMTQHTGERAFTCEICSKTFRIRETLRRHLQSHFDPKPHKCSTCGLSYAQKDTLAEHMLKHEGVRKYECDQCGKTFAQKSHLAAHKFVHQEKSFVCLECGARFNRNDNMKAHYKRHFKDIVVKQENGVENDKATKISKRDAKKTKSGKKNNNAGGPKKNGGMKRNGVDVTKKNAGKKKNKIDMKKKNAGIKKNNDGVKKREAKS